MIGCEPASETSRINSQDNGRHPNILFGFDEFKFILNIIVIKIT